MSKTSHRTLFDETSLQSNEVRKWVNPNFELSNALLSRAKVKSIALAMDYANSTS
jgi:hypothetical protein